MATTLYYHPQTRATATLVALEELGRPYELTFVDVMKGAQKEAGFLKMNPMGKLPTLDDDGVVVSEAAAIGLYLADRYAMGRLAPAFDDSKRAAYLRWSLFAPSVIEPGCTAKLKNFDISGATAGWGDYEAMLDTISHAIGAGPWLLGEMFSMADVIFGSTLGFMTRFNMIEKRPEFLAYVERLDARPAVVRATDITNRLIQEHGLAQ